MKHGVDDRFLLTVVIDKLALIRRTDVEEAVVAAHPLLLIINISTGNLAHGHLNLLYRHHNFFGCLLRINSFGNFR